ncbi:hypothetical protein SRHO_G00114380 [Serrasalmus rhombeus]
MPAPTNRTKLGNPEGRGERSWRRWYECQGMKKDIGALRQPLLSWANWILLVETETHSPACGPIQIAVVLLGFHGDSRDTLLFKSERSRGRDPFVLERRARNNTEQMKALPSLNPIII